jgi:hypothetical protein
MDTLKSGKPEEGFSELKNAYEDYQTRVISKKNMDPNYVIKLDLDSQCEYADNITIKYVEDKRFLDSLIKNFRGIDENTNACAIGNIAYISKHHNNTPLLELLSKLRE